MVHFVALLNLLGYVYHCVQNICRLLYHMRRHCFLKQQEALLQYIWHVALTAPRSALHTCTALCFNYSVCVHFCCYLLCIMTLCVFRLLSLYSLMSVLMLSWCGYWVLLLLLAGWIEWSSSKRSLARRCVTCCTTAFTIDFFLGIEHVMRRDKEYRCLFHCQHLIFVIQIVSPAEIMNDMQLFLRFKMLSNNMHMSKAFHQKIPFSD